VTAAAGVVCAATGLVKMPWVAKAAARMAVINRFGMRPLTVGMSEKSNWLPPFGATAYVSKGSTATFLQDHRHGPTEWINFW
jgi:hypothetical protein